MLSRTFVLLQLLSAVHLVLSHGELHEEHGEHGGLNWQYAQKHMATEHHIDSFDPKSFFHIHDLNRDGFLDREEIEAVYGVHHPYSQKKSLDEKAHQDKADHIVNVVLNIMDKNKDGKVSLEEFEASGVNALPSFEGLGAEGHHYDVESEFFLHHEEQYHSTPETQTDESYVHPEDSEHFAQHEEIERQEVIKEAKFQGISVEEALAEHERAEAVAAEHYEHPEQKEQEPVAGEPVEDFQSPPHPHDDQQPQESEPVSSPPKIQRQTPPEKLDPSVRYQNARKDGELYGEWGSGSGGYKIPKTPSERMRKNVPYKYKFRRNWGDF